MLLYRPVKKEWKLKAELAIKGLMRTRQIDIYQATDLFFSLLSTGKIFISDGIKENELPKN